MLLYSVGSALLERDELVEGGHAAAIRSYAAGVGAGAQPLALPNGELMADAAAAPTPFTAIGLNKPLTVDIREVYTGKFPASNLFSGDKDLLLTTATKGYAEYDAQARALNFLKRKVGKQARFYRPPPSEAGTPIVYYSPAITQRSLSIEVTMVFDTFPDQAFTAVSNAMKGAAVIPLFMAQGSYLLAASEVIRLAGQMGEAIFDGRPAMNVTVGIDLELPGSVPAMAGFMLVLPDNVDQLDPRLRKDYLLNAEGKLVDSANTAYSGEVPYVVLNLDGAPRDDLAAFTPRAVSAAMLSRFFGMKDGQSIALGPVVEALQLYSDFHYHQEVKRVKTQIEGAQGEAKAKLEQKRDALLKNIGNELFKPKE